MSQYKPFFVFDCTLLRQASGHICSNLRELLETMKTASDEVLEHHMMRCALEDYFELYEFPNDLARWCWQGLGDHVLGEKLGLIDPYRMSSIEQLREELVNTIEERLWSLERVPWSRAGSELQLLKSRLVGYDTGERLTDPGSLEKAIERMSLRSLFFHVHEACRRNQGAIDDFSLWLEGTGASAALIERLRRIDFYFLNLTQLREEILLVLQQELPYPKNDSETIG